MIARQSLRRQSRNLDCFTVACPRRVTSPFSIGTSDIALSRINRALPIQSWRRGLAYAADPNHGTLQNSIPQTHSAEPSQQSRADKDVPLVEDGNQTTTDPLKDETTEMSDAEILDIRHRQAKGRQIGTRVGEFYTPQSLLIHPPRPEAVTLELLLASQSHLGHSTSLWNPMNARYIYGIRQGIHIISLDVTAAHLRRACRVVSGIAERGGLILFAGTRKGQDRCVVNAAKMAKGYHLFDPWVPGALTNAHEILKKCQLKVVDEFDRDIPGHEENLAHMPPLKPDLVICLNPLENWTLLHECGINTVPTIGIIDTDANPTWVTYPIPANDDSLRCVQLIAGVLGRAAQQGNRERFQMALRGEVLYTATQLGQPRTKDTVSKEAG
ncbi:MAG: hypothetical protein Q9191_001016 [Dirinaria sp. TL-2023a]